ncbi:MAG: hypothetical protein Q9M13_03160, partial [Mariprofundales bacterium]|nr:hypothetical protein [Mariprofundales bacterium]
LDDQEHREIFIQDQRGRLSLAKKQGLQQGLQQGMKQGREEGRVEGAITTQMSIAQSLLPLLNDAEIASSTGLSIEEVQKLR